MMKQTQSVKPVDPASLRGLSSHAETHWLTFATALRCYARRPAAPTIDHVADRHGPSWLRSALRGEKKPARPSQRPPELDPQTGSLAFLTRGAERLLHEGAQPSSPSPAARETLGGEAVAASLRREEEHQKRLERYLSLAAARVDIARRGL